MRSQSQKRFEIQCLGPWSLAQTLMRKLREAGIECGAADGCIAIYILPHQRGTMRRNCYFLTGNRPTQRRW